MTMVRRRMKEWLSKKKASVKTKLSRNTTPAEPPPLVQFIAPSSDTLAALPQELRDEIFDYLAPGSYIRGFHYAYNRLGTLYITTSHSAGGYGGESAGMLQVNRRYREQFTSRIQAAGIDHHHVRVTVDLSSDTTPPDFVMTGDPGGLVAYGASRLTIWLTVRCQKKGIKWTDPAELESPRFYDMLVSLIDAYRRRNDPIHKQQVVVFINFEDLPSTSLGLNTTLRSKLYWKITTWRLIRALRPHVQDGVIWDRYKSGGIFSNGRSLKRTPEDYMEWFATQWDNDATLLHNDGSRILPPYFGGISVFAKDLTSSKSLVHFWFRPEQMLVAAQIQQAHQIRREARRQLKAMRKQVAAIEREQALLQVKIWWYKFKLLGHRDEH